MNEELNKENLSDTTVNDILKEEATTENTSAAENVAEETDVLAKMTVELNEQRDKYLRLYAEFDNFRRRAAKERSELEKTANRRLMQNLLPTLDDFDRAQKAAETTGEVIPEGLRLVMAKFVTTLEQQGLKPMVSTGEPFNADFHEAVTEFPAPSEDMKGKVFDTLEKGYFLGETIIRFAKVVVGK